MPNTIEKYQPLVRRLVFVLSGYVILKVEFLDGMLP